MGRGVRVQVWIPATHVADLDLRRGKTPRAAYIREILFPEKAYDLETPEGRLDAIASITLDLLTAASKLEVDRLKTALRGVALRGKEERDEEAPTIAKQLTAQLDAITNAQSGVDADIEPPMVEELH